MTVTDRGRPIAAIGSIDAPPVPDWLRVLVSDRRRMGRRETRTSNLVKGSIDEPGSDQVAHLVASADFVVAKVLADVHRLRGGDAVHLASFETIVARAGHEDVQFSCADDRLSRAARALR
jgi:hypothetical protein